MQISKRAVFIVYRTSKVLCLSSKSLISSKVDTTGNDELHQDHLANPLRLALEEFSRSTGLAGCAHNETNWAIVIDNDLWIMRFASCTATRVPDLIASDNAGGI